MRNVAVVVATDWKMEAGSMRIVAVVAWLALMAAGCVESACYSHSDCSDGKVCFSDGKCRVPECTSTPECGAKKVCEGFKCVDGCTTQDECDDGYVCTSNRCVPVDTMCQCPSAPGFCLKDVNPGSSSHTQELCLESMKGHSVVLFFGSIACSHCHSIYNRLLELRDGLVADGLTPTLLFVNLKTVPLDSGAISSLMPEAVLPLLQDTDGEDVWGMFSANWYEVVLIDRNGCLLWHSGDLSTGGLQGQGGEAFAQLWGDAEKAECTAPTDVVPQPDAVTDLVTDSKDSADSPETLVEDLLDTKDSQPLPDVSDMTDVSSPDVADTADADALQDLSDDDVVFELKEYCQIETVPPIKVGEKVPTFLCMNRSLSSGGIGEAVSDLTLNGMVWVAYTGACT